MLNAILVGIFIFTVLVVGQLIGLLTWKQTRLEKRLKSMSIHLNAQAIKEEHRVRRSPNSWLKSTIIPTLVGKPYLDKLQAILIKAGIPLKSEEMITLTLFSGVVLVLVGLLTLNPAFAALLGFVGLLGPVLWVTLMLRHRINRIEGQLLDAVVLMANSLRGGHSFMQALELVSRETIPPLSEEFAKVVRETKVGISTEEALNNLKSRVQSADMEMVVTGVLLQRQVGGNLAQILDTVADTIEKRIRMRGKIRALTAQGKMTAWVISLLPFGLAAMVFGKYPEFGKVMFEEPMGLLMLGGGTAMLIMGVVLIRKVVNIDV